MNDPLLYEALAIVVLLLHLGIVAFVVGGLVLIVVGNLRGWHRVNAFWFRLAHLTTVAIIVAEAWLGMVCPLTSLEMWLRLRAHTSAYAGSLIEHWVRQILYYDAPAWSFILGYSLFALAAAAAWYYFPPNPRRPAHVEKPSSSQRR